MSEHNPILQALCAASEPLGDSIEEITGPDGRRHLVPATNPPRMRPAQACPKCKGELYYYDGALGYEALKCHACDYELDLNAEANAKATAERLAKEPPAGFHAPEQAPTNALAAKVAATNRANHAVVLLQRYVAQRLRPFIGQKVLKNTGWGMGLTKKVSQHIGEIKCDREGEHFHISAQGAWISVRLSVSRCYKDEHRESSMSYEAYASVAKVEGDLLKELIEPPKLRTDYTEAEIRGKRALLRELEEKVRDARSALDGFGEYDR